MMKAFYSVQGVYWSLSNLCTRKWEQWSVLDQERDGYLKPEEGAPQPVPISLAMNIDALEVELLELKIQTLWARLAYIASGAVI